MATKKRRSSTTARSLSKGTPRSYGEMYKNETTVRQPTPMTETSSAATAKVMERQDWRVEYSHVLRDLKTLSVVSVVLFAIIIVTGFFM